MAPKKDTKKQPQLAGPGAQRLSRQAPPLVASAGGRAGPHVVQRGRSAKRGCGSGAGSACGAPNRATHCRAQALTAALALAGPSVRPGGVMVPPEAKAGAEPTPDDKGIMELIAGMSPWAEVRRLCDDLAAHCVACCVQRPPARPLRAPHERRRPPGARAALRFPRPNRAGRLAPARGCRCLRLARGVSCAHPPCWGAPLPRRRRRTPPRWTSCRQRTQSQRTLSSSSSSRRPPWTARRCWRAWPRRRPRRLTQSPSWGS